MYPGQEGNQLFLKQGFIITAKCKACSKEDKQDSKMLSSFPGAHSLFTIPTTGPDPNGAEPFQHPVNVSVFCSFS